MRPAIASGRHNHNGNTDAQDSPRAHRREPAAHATPLAASTRQTLRCPCCGSDLYSSPEEFSCRNAVCGQRFPVVDGIPVLIDEATSLFDIADFVEQRPTTWPSRPRLTRLAARVLPALSLHARSGPNLDRFAALLPGAPGMQRVLVIGGRSLGHGMARLLSSERIELVETDIAFGPRTRLICDAHAIPFADGAFDGVVIQAVLQYVQDPARVADEIHRVLRDDGIVYAEVPFVQHGLEGYDFNRFTLLGLRRLFRRFEQISADALVGPATTLNWSLQYFLLSFVSGRAARALAKGSARLVFFWVKGFDRLLLDRPAATDAACEIAFLGRKSATTLSDRDLVRTHRKFW